ncbi:tetratricopeptide repeat-containing sensor histidine kinase [Sabulibacter ruber]|uniref:tetratricopeptide repeat-containing sensor histidine kinase n=1 Tax=Sabulibacter ruber TaxID=2811901 RepID=UPI001A95C41A|nr:ATP-binding protein [Sabulibacter ruber]
MVQWIKASSILVLFWILALPTQAQTGGKGQYKEGVSRVEAEVDSLNQLAFSVKRQNVDKALSLLQKALLLAQSSNYKKGEATCYLYEAGIYQQNGYSKSALSLYYKALEISQATKDTFNIARALQQVANALLEDKQLDRAEQIYVRTLQNYAALERWEDVVNVRNSIGLIELEQNEFAHSEQYFTQALQESKAKNYQYGFKKANFHLGLLYLKTGELPKARVYFQNALELDQKANDKYGLSLAKNKLALVSSREGNYKEAINLATAALQDARSINAAKLEAEVMQTLVAVYKTQKKHEEVARWQDSLIQKESELFARERTFALNFLDVLKEKQEQQLAYEKSALLASQKAKITSYALAFVMGISIALATIVYLLLRNYRKAQDAKEELATKNAVIEKHSLELDTLNKSIVKQNESLEQTNQMKDKLLSILSHDLKAPLANTKGILQLINSGRLEEKQYKPMLVELEKQYVRSLALLENLLFWIKSQVKGDTIRPEKLSLKTLLQEVIGEQEAAALNKRISILNEVDAELWMEGDPEMLKVVFRNLLSNAVKFTRKEGRILVTAEVQRGLLVKIEDQGIGISEDALNKIKRKSYFTTMGTDNERGSGFGLMICEELISKHGGELLVESEVNKGSLFTVKLPASAIAQRLAVAV